MLHTILPILVFLYTILNGMILYGFAEMGPLSEFVKNFKPFAGMIIIIGIPIFYLVVYKAYIGPVQRLNKSIAKFMTGIDEDPQLEARSWSKGMNYIIGFFIKSLQILKVFKQELRDGRKLRSEVEIASEIQRKVIGNDMHVIPSLEIAMASCPASEVGGDSLDIIPGKNGNYYIYVGDVTGHGVPSGFVMMMVNALVSAFVISEESSARVLSETNRILKPRIKQNMMMTCVMLRWNEITKTLYYTGGGHEYLLLYKAKENKVYKIKSGGVALGMVKDVSKVMVEQQILFELDDVIILYTDGITEARYRSEQNGLLFGIDRIVESIMKAESKTAESIFRRLTIDLSSFMGYKYKQYDDITLLVARNVGSGGVILSSIQDTIDPMNITEWNWGKKASHSSAIL